MVLILQSVCKFKYYITLAVPYFPDSRQAEWDFYYLHMFKDKENFSIFFSWWTAGGRASSRQTSLNSDMNMKWGSHRFLLVMLQMKRREFERKGFKPEPRSQYLLPSLELVPAVTPTEFLMRLSSRGIGNGDWPRSCCTWPPCCGHAEDSLSNHCPLGQRQ